MLDFNGFYAATYVHVHTIQIFMWAWYPESAKIHQKVSGGFWRIQDMSNIYTGGFWWIQDTSILCVTKLVDFGGFRILSSKNIQGVRVNDLSEVQLCMSSNRWTWECPHTKDGADHVPLIFLSSEVTFMYYYPHHAKLQTSFTLYMYM